MNDRTRSALRSSSIFGGCFAAWSLVKAIGSVAAGTAPPLVLVAGPAFTFAIFGGGAFVLLITGVASTNKRALGDPKISPWFAWLIGGAFALLWVGTFAMANRDNPVQWGELTAALWAAGVLVAWAVVRLRKRGVQSPSVAPER
jgi:hypothetical protein